MFEGLFLGILGCCQVLHTLIRVRRKEVFVIVSGFSEFYIKVPAGFGGLWHMKILK